MKEKGTTKRKRWLFVLLGILLFVVAVLGVLEIGAIYTGKTWKQWYPDYERIEISSLLDKETLSEEEYDTLYRQTGLTKLAIDDMRDTEYGKMRILKIQDAFFTEYKVNSRWFNLYTYTDEVDKPNRMCAVKDGDIIVTATTRVSWWRYGHAALVVDGERRLIAESIAPGTKSELASMDVCAYFADFLILRPKVEESVKTELSQFVMKEMIGLPYRFTVGILSKKNPKKLEASQCAHFVWYAYKKYGVDLDSNGGGLVKPQDIALSDKVELVQAFGFDLDKLWSK